MCAKDVGLAVAVFAIKLFLGLGHLADEVGRDHFFEDSLWGGFVAGEGVTLRTMDQVEVAGVLAVDELFFTHGGIVLFGKGECVKRREGSFACPVSVMCWSQERKKGGRATENV